MYVCLNISNRLPNRHEICNLLWSNAGQDVSHQWGYIIMSTCCRSAQWTVIMAIRLR